MLRGVLLLTACLSASVCHAESAHYHGAGADVALPPITDAGGGGVVSLGGVGEHATLGAHGIHLKVHHSSSKMTAAARPPTWTGGKPKLQVETEQFKETRDSNTGSLAAAWAH